MNPHDTILEQLRKAQQRGVETVSNRLEFVLESLETIVNEAKEAVKEAVPNEPDELFPLGECSRAVEEARGALEASESRVRDLEARVQELEQAAAGPGGALSLEVLRRLDAARTQSELLKELLPTLLDHVGRAVVLVVREGTVNAWSGIGFENGERLRDWSAKVVESPVLEKFVHENSVVRFSPAGDSLFASWLEGEAKPTEGVIIPVVLRGHTVGGVYADRLDRAPWDVESAQVMVATACWLIDTLSYRKTVPSPTLQEPVDLGAGPADEGGRPVEDEDRAGEAADVAEEETTREAGYPPVVEDEALGRHEPEPEAPAAPVGAEEEAASEELATTVQVDAGTGWQSPGSGQEAPAVEEPTAAPAVEPVTPPPAEPVEPPAVEPVTPPPVEPVTPPAEQPPEPAAVEETPVQTAPPPVSPVVPPPPVSPVVPPPRAEEPAAGAGSGGQSAEDEAKHEEARRFARLLVSEIKLYNPEEVERGRANNDIYQRLKEDIDRSLEMYEKRISEEVRTSHDYFREALIRILADGDEDALGM